MNPGFRLFAVSLVLSVLSVRAETGENQDFLRGDAIYQNGKGDANAFPSAFEAFRLAAEKGHGRSQHYLGRMYQFGDGVGVNVELAERWYLLAGEKGESQAWNNLGNIYGGQGKSEEVILRAFSRSSDLGDPLGSFNLGIVLQFGSYGVRPDCKRALEYYHKTLQQKPDYPDAWGRIGSIHASGGAGVKADKKAAEEAYLSGIRASDDSYCYYRLYQLYSNGKLPPRDIPALSYLVKAAEKGHGLAAEIAAEECLDGWDGAKPDPVRAAYFLDLGAKAGRGASILWLYTLAREKENGKVLVEHYGQETIQAWIDGWKKMDNAARKEVDGDLLVIRKMLATGDESHANAMIDAAFNRWKSRTKDGYVDSYLTQTWNTGQFGTGRADPEWRRFLFAWLIPVYKSQENSSTLLGAITNFNSAVEELGRYGLLRESCARTKPIIKESECVDVDAVRKLASIGPDLTILGAEKLPLVVDDETSSHERTSREDMIGGQAMSMIMGLGQQCLTIGDWQSALVFSEWVTLWSDKLTADKRKPDRDYPGCQAEMQLRPSGLKADVFSALGLPEKGAAACQAIIDNKLWRGAYGGRNFFKAQYRQAGFLADQGQAGKVDIDNLVSVEEKMRNNKHNNSHDWQFSKLVRARVLAAREGMDVARQMVSEVLASSAQDQRPLLRLEALLVSADLELKAGKTEGVEASLEEALAWARKQGLLVSELHTVELYVTYLIQTGNYDQAMAMQQRVLELIDAMKLTPRRERAVLRFAEVLALRGDNAAAFALLDKVKSPELSRGIEGVRGLLARKNVKPLVALKGIDLQPMRIQSMPLRKVAEAVFMLANPNPSAYPVELTFGSSSFGLVLKENSPEELVVQALMSQSSANQPLVVKVEVPGNGRLPISLFAEGLATLNGEASVTIQANTSARADAQKSKWLIQPKGSEFAVAVVDAAQLRNSAFDLIPVYHHLDSLDAAKGTAALRVVASEPTRVEGYASDGTLLFVDAQGNGSFRDPGDLIATSEVDELFPVLDTGAETGRIGLRYQPESRGSHGRIELRIETRLLGGNGVWQADAIDWLEP